MPAFDEGLAVGQNNYTSRVTFQPRSQFVELNPIPIPPSLPVWGVVAIRPTLSGMDMSGKMLYWSLSGKCGPAASLIPHPISGICTGVIDFLPPPQIQITSMGRLCCLLCNQQQLQKGLERKENLQGPALSGKQTQRLGCNLRWEAGVLITTSLQHAVHLTAPKLHL